MNYSNQFVDKLWERGPPHQGIFRCAQESQLFAFEQIDTFPLSQTGFGDH